MTVAPCTCISWPCCSCHTPKPVSSSLYKFAWWNPPSAISAKPSIESTESHLGWLLSFNTRSLNYAAIKSKQ